MLLIKKIDIGMCLWCNVFKNGFCNDWFFVMLFFFVLGVIIIK